MRNFAHLDYITAHLSISYMCQNLSVGLESMLFAHRDQIFVLNKKSDAYKTKVISLSNKSIITQARICQLRDVTFIVVTTEQGMQVFDSMGKTLLYSYHPRWGEDEALPFCRGIAALNAFGCIFLIIGTALGTLLMFRYNDENSDFDMIRELDGHSSPIRTIEATDSGQIIATADDSGLITVRNSEQDFDLTHRLPSHDYPITAMRFCLDTWLICGCLTGHIYIYHAEDFTLYVQIAAHTRGIMALDTSGDYFVTVGEDTFLNVWCFAGPETSPDIELIASHQVNDEVLVGVAFDGGTNALLTAAYDRTYLNRWALD